MRFEMLHLFENPIDKTEHDVIHQQMQLMRAAEDLGFDSVWPAEHHFTEYGNCASPALSLFAKLAGLILLLAVVATSQVHASDRSYQALLSWLEQDADAPADGLAPGTYGRDRLAALSRYIPPGYIKEFDFQELELEIEETRHYEPHRIYQEATARYVDQSTITANGNLEGYIAGMPFSREAINAAPADKLGYMVAWNHIHRWQYFGFIAPETIIAFVSPTATGSAGEKLDGMEGGGHVDRYLSMSYRRVYLSKLAQLPDQEYRLGVEGSKTLLFKEKIELMAPFDVAGTTLIVERPLDQSEGDLVNSYLPSERRVRRLSAKERADSWMGTHWTLDDFGGYSGLVMDNTWSYLGRKVIPYVANSKHELALTHGPISVIPLDRWQLRPCFVVDAIPKWNGHPYGRRVLFIDEETFSVATVLVFDRKDSLSKVMTNVYERSEEVTDQDPSMTTSRMHSSIVINMGDHTANIARLIKPTEYHAVEPSQVRRIFSVADLNSGR